MVQYQQGHLDAAFAALADSTRRGVLERLGGSEASITDLADRFHMTLTGMSKHIRVLERAGLVTTEKVGRVRNCRIGKRRLEEVAAWIQRYQELWDARFSALDDIVEDLKRQEKIDEHKQHQRSRGQAESRDRGTQVRS
jgi:DNA-binding transcriptional ArsR family regulator